MEQHPLVNVSDSIATVRQRDHQQASFVLYTIVSSYIDSLIIMIAKLLHLFPQLCNAWSYLFQLLLRSSTTNQLIQTIPLEQKLFTNVLKDSA